MNKFIVLILLIFLFGFWIFWLPGNRVANDYHLAQHIPTIEQILPWIWRETNVADGLGEYTGITLWAQPLHSFFGAFSVLSIPPSLQTKFLGSIAFILGLFSLSKLFQFLNIGGIGKYLGIFFFLTNSYFLLLFDGGQISLALAYVISPLVAYLFLKMMENYELKYKLYLAISLLIVSILDIRFIYLLGIILFLSFIFKLYFTEGRSMQGVLIKEVLLSTLLIGVILALFHIYWLLPSILVKPLALPQTYERTSQIDFLSFSSVGHSLLLQQPHWYKNIFGQISNLSWEFIFIPILVLLAPVLQRKDKVVGFWLTVAAFGMILSKGSQEPFGQIYPWLFTHIPGFSLFRDPTKFYLYISLAYSILIAISIQEISLIKTNFAKRILKIVPFVALIYFSWLIRPIYLGQMTGLLSLPAYENNFSELSEYLKKDTDYSRVFWLPTKAPLGYVSNVHPSVEAVRFAQKRPFAVGIKGSYETFNFLREAPYMGQIFDISEIGYVVYPPLDPKRDDMHPDNVRYFNIFQDQLSKLPWLSKVEESEIPLFRTTKHQDKFFLSPNIWWVIGSDSIYNEATKSAGLQLSKNALIFTEEFGGLGKKIEGLPNAKIVLNNKSLTDLAASFINPENLIFPARNLNFSPNSSGWWKREAADLISWRAFLQEKYGIDNQDFDLGGGWAVGEGNRKYQIRLPAFGRTNIKYQKEEILLTRVMESSRSGSLRFIEENGKLIGEVATKTDGLANVRWFEVGELQNGGENLSIESSGDINVVIALAILDRNEWNNFKNKAEGFKERVVNFDEKNSLDGNAKVTYKKINPTKYVVNVTGLSSPSMLIFSQNYDSLWKLNGQSPLPVYSLLNGFRIEKDGTYIVEFEAQKYVFPGLIVSGLTVVILAILLIRYRKLNH